MISLRKKRIQSSATNRAKRNRESIENDMDDEDGRTNASSNIKRMKVSKYGGVKDHSDNRSSEMSNCLLNIDSKERREDSNKNSEKESSQEEDNKDNRFESRAVRSVITSLILAGDDIKEELVSMMSEEYRINMTKKVEKIIITNHLGQIAECHKNARPILLLINILTAINSSLPHTSLGSFFTLLITFCIKDLESISKQPPKKRPNWRIIREKDRSDILDAILQE